MLISVYIPTKNRSALLSAAIDSVLKQSYENFEIIVVDDGSTDDTGIMLESLVSQDSRLRFIRHAQSQGGAAARNAAILASRGDFVTGLDDDDTFTVDRLELFSATWRKFECSGLNPPSGLYSQINVLESGKVVSKTNKPESTTFEDMFRENVVGNQIFAPRRNYVDAGLFRATLPAWQDLEFFMRVLKKFGPAKLVDAPTYNWDNSPRGDRISLKSEEKLRLAFNMVASLHGGSVPRRTQLLYLQLLGRFYGVRPTLKDLSHFLRLGFWPYGWLRLLRNQLY